MKKIVLIFLLICSTFGFSQSQEWMTSLDVAKKLALVQNKMIFAVWENASLEKYPVLIKDEEGKVLIVDLFENESLSKIIWNYFVPVIIRESSYPDLFEEIKGKRNENYIIKFNDDSIKIMDVNGNIINTNTSTSNDSLLNIASFIDRYSLNTSFLKQDLISYSTEKSFTTSHYLASKYIDFACLNDTKIRSEIIELSGIYLNEANEYLEFNSSNNKLISVQANNLLKIKQYLVLNRPKKVIKQLKKISNSEIFRVNQSLFNFLNYTAFELLKDEKKALLWKNKVSLVDLKKANLIINSNS